MFMLYMDKLAQELEVIMWVENIQPQLKYTVTGFSYCEGITFQIGTVLRTQNLFHFHLMFRLDDIICSLVSHSTKWGEWTTKKLISTNDSTNYLDELDYFEKKSWDKDTNWDEVARAISSFIEPIK
jgi:hypothetical protein